MDQSKFFLRSRRVGAGLLALYAALHTFGGDVGLSVPDFSGVLGIIVNSFTSDDGILAKLGALYATVMTLALAVRGSDGATLKLLPGTGTLPLGGTSFALVLLACLIGIAPAPARAAEAVFVPYAPAVGRWTWTPAENATAYNVHASRNGGAFALAAAVTTPEVTLRMWTPGGPPLRIGETIVVVVEPLAPGSGASPGPLSAASSPRTFRGTTDTDGNGTTGMSDHGSFANSFGCRISPSASGVAVPATNCPPPVE